MATETAADPAPDADRERLTPRSVTTVGVAGWGRMGASMGQFLVRGGWPVIGTDPSSEARDAMVAAGARAAGSPADVAAEADLVLVVVVDDDQVRQVVSGHGGLLEAARPGTVIAVCASVRPDTCAQLAEQAAATGVLLIDVGLVGGERGAEQAALKLYCGGDDAAIEACRPAFSAFAIDVCSIGAIGAGQVGKAVNNLLLWACLRADVEALRLGKALGVEPGKLRAFLSVGSGANRALSDWGLHRLRWPAKDLEVSLGLAEDVGLDLPLMRSLPALMDELSAADLEALR
jgi:3-hydroxyisobutyrate dehydrogenase-like beta-hydroxyacid dehydrogenase